MTARRNLLAESLHREGEDFAFPFPADAIKPPSYAGIVPTWTHDDFIAQCAWLERQRETALAELAATERTCVGKVARRLRDGLERQVRHADYLLRLVLGGERAPYDGSRDRWEAAGDSVLESALWNAYGADPRDAFASVMSFRGLIPTDYVVDAGAMLRRFHLVGDPPGTKNGWAVLHRTPPAGSFGSWRTGEVHVWHSRPERMEQDREQFANDYARAVADRDDASRKRAA